MPNQTLFFGVFLALSVFSLHASPLAVKSVTKDDTGVTLAMQTGMLQLQVCGDRTIHVLYSTTNNLPKDPTGFAVQEQPVPGQFDVAETADTVTLKIAQDSVAVDRKTGALSFLGSDRKLLLHETADGGKILTPSIVAGIQTNTVEQKFVLDPTEALYGLGQHKAGTMNYVGTKVHLQQKNGDIAIPVLVSSKGYGVFWNNPSVTDVSFNKASDPHPTVDWKSEFGSAIDYYVFLGPSIDQVIADYRNLTGAAPMFGRWGWGFWQCKQRYHSQEQLLETVARYRQMQVPIDGIIQDWLWWYPNPWGSHQFGEERYPDPVGMMKQLHDKNVHLLISVWAKFDVGSDNANQLNAAGALFSKVLPYVHPAGKGQWYDPFSPEGRRIYWNQLSKQVFSKGVDGWWLDASEAEFSGHWGEFRDFSTTAGPGALVFNAYPLMHTTGVYQGQRAENPNKRVFILTRSAYAGQQRNATVAWSGDIHGTWEVFRSQIPAGINFSLSGIPYWNTDTGGFFGGSPSDPKYAELFTRWFQFSAFCPMFRVHGDATRDSIEPTKKDNPGKEIWQFPPETQKILIAYDKLRYHLLPYIYSDSWKVTNDGSTMMRGLVMDFQNDPQVYNIPDQYMFGPALMVSPVTTSYLQQKPTDPIPSGPQTRKVYLPAGTTWIDFWTGKITSGGQSVDAGAPIETLPLYVRSGSIIPYGPEVQSATEKEDPIELRVYRGADGAFTLYEDEGDNYNYEKGVYATIPFKWNEKSGMLTIGDRKGNFPGMLEQRKFHIVWVAPGHGAGLDSTEKADAEIAYDGHEIAIHAPSQ
jgi:alpha-D-xyloside xylohydrolase